MLLALLAQHADRVDEAADELGTFFDHLRQIGIRGLLAEKAGDPDFAVATAKRPVTSGGRRQPDKETGSGTRDRARRTPK